MLGAPFKLFQAPSSGKDAYSVVLTNETQVVACNSDGSLKAGELDRAITDIQVYRGNTLLTWNVDWVIDETIFTGAYFSAYMSSIKLSYFENGSISGTCEIGIMIGTIYIYKTFSVTKVIDVPVPFTTKEPWSTSSVFQNGQYLRYEGKVYIWTYPYPGNSALNPKDDIISNPITTHWKGYEIWELVATDFLLSRLIKAEEIDVDSLVAKLLKTANSGPRVEIFGSMLNVYGNFANPNIKFGVNANGQAVLTYYDNNGNKIYDLGPKGFDWGSIVPASWSSTRLTKICNVLTGNSIPTWGNITSQALTSVKNVSASTGSDYYQYYAGSNPALTDADRINEQYLFVYQYVNSSKIEDGWYARSTNGHLQYMSHNTQNWIKPEPGAIYEYAAGVRDQDPIYMDMIVEYIGGMPVREINIFWNQLIVEY